MGSSGFSYKTTVPQNSLVGPQGHIVNKFLRLSGSASETNNAVGDYSTNTGSFYLQPPAGEIWRVHRMLVTVLNTSSATSIDQYAGIATLANGIKVQVVNGVTQDLTNDDPIKKLIDWATYCYDIDLKNKVNNGNTCYAGVRWTFANSGQEIRLIGDNGDRIEVVCRDDLSDLTEHHFLIQGYKETSQY